MTWFDNLLVKFMQARGFVIGAGVVQPADQGWGKLSERFQPAEYGEYLATSNAVYACATLRAELLASLGLELYKLNSRGERSEVETGNLYALLQKVNPYWTFNRLLVMTELSLCLWGECFWFLERGQNGADVPKEIWWARPDQVKVFPHPTEYLDPVKAFAYFPLTVQAEIPFSKGEVIWFRFPNPIDEYEGLAPLAAARLAADYASAAMKSNRNLFENGLQIGGTISPPKDSTWTVEQAENANDDLSRRFKGVDKAHRFAIFRQDIQVKEFGINPKEAEFLGGLKWALEDVARAYRVPLDLVGGQRTYENTRAAEKAIWTRCLIPEARFIATELVEQLLPMFPGEADLCEFAVDDIDALQDEISQTWQRDKEQIALGAKTINEWRDEQGLEKLVWGDTWWTAISNVPVSASEPPTPTQNQESARARLVRTFAIPHERQLEFGGVEHTRLWNRFVRRADPYEKRCAKLVRDLFQRQRDSIVAKLKQRARALEDDPFDRAQWIKTFRTEVRPLLNDIIASVGADALADLALDVDFKVNAPKVLRFLEKRTQRFAQEVNATTWDRLKGSLSEGVQAGENISQLSERVDAVMGERIRSSAETIARTETIGAANGGTLLAYEQSGVVKSKRWLAAIDERTRETHIQAHNQEVGLDEDFHVGAGEGQAPGQIGLPEEDINCRCTMTAVLE